jgi:hypothetical protein
MKKIYLFLVIFILSLKYKAQVNVSGGTSATYSTVNDAFNAINLGIHTGAIAIDITGNTTEPSTPTVLIASGQGAANYSSIILRPTVTATISGNMVTGRGILELDGADNVTINGDILGGAVGRDLTIIHTGATTLANTACVRLLGKTTGGLGATNFSLLNCIIFGNSDGANTAAPLTSSFGFYAGTNAATITTTGLGDNYDNLVITNNEFKRSYQAIYCGNTLANPGDNILINNNIIGSSSPAEYVHFRGVNLSSAVNSTVSTNDISNLRISSSASNAGIEINGASGNNVLVERNKIYSIYSTSNNGWGAWGINCTGGANHTIVNNVIYDIVTTNYLISTTFNAFGIRLTAGTNYRVYFNSVNLFGDYSTVTTNVNAISSCFLVTAAAVTGDVRNNIFCNQMTSSATNVTNKRFMAVWLPTGYNFANMNFNNNAYMISNASTTDYLIGKLGTAAGTFEYQTLAAWQPVSQVANPTNDINSIPLINGVAPFISNTNLNFAPNTVTSIESGAVTLTVLGTPNKDHNNVNRPAGGVNPNTNPDIGAYEFDGLAGVSNDVGILSIVSPAPLQCLNGAVQAVVTIRNYGTNTIAAGTQIPVNIITSGAFSQTIASTYTVPGGGLPSLTNVNFTLTPTLNMAAFGAYTLLASTSMTAPLDPVAINNSVTATRNNATVATIPILNGFAGFTGANLITVFPDWYEANGAAFPNGTTSSWLSQTNLGGAGNVTARVNLIGNTKREWIVGPKFNATSASFISFDLALTNAGGLLSTTNMGSDDQLLVMVSTDCGASYSPIFTVSTTNSLTNSFSNFNLPLSSYAGQPIIIGFLATEGLIDDPENVDLHLDNINIYNLVPNDAGINGFISPAVNGCYSATNSVIAVLRNFGSNTLTNIPYSVVVTGPVATTLTNVFTGTLAPSATVAVTAGTLNMSVAGTFTLKGYSSLLGDGNNTNDTTLITRAVNPLVTLPINNGFTGFTGANLPTVQPNWREAQGFTAPTGTTSTWTFLNNFNGTGNVSARINLSATLRNDWIVAPRTLATSSSQVSFDVAVAASASTITPAAMGSDDMVRVMVSTDCGVSFTPIYTLNVANTNSTSVAYTNHTVSLAPFSGQEVIVAFFATDGPVDDPETYDFHLDNINLFNVLGNDAGVTAINSPTSGACYTATETVVVTLKNFGSAAISNVPVNVIVSGAATATITNTYVPSILPGATVIFTVGTLNMSGSGAYSFTASTGLLGDVNTFNNIALLTLTTNPVFSLNGPTQICSGSSATLTISTPPTSYTWSTGSTVPSIVVSPTTASTYSVLGTDGTCFSQQSLTLTVTNPTISALNATVCSSIQIATLTATGFAPVNWFATPTSTSILASGNNYTASAASTTTFYAEAQQATLSNSIQTTYTAGNGCGGGAMIDVNPNFANMTVDSLIYLPTSAGVVTVNIYTKNGTYLGFETNSVAWTLHSSYTITSGGASVPTKIVLNSPINLVGPTALYINGDLRYSSGAATYSNPDMTVTSGIGLCGFFATTNNPRTFNGTLFYSKQGCNSPRIPVVLNYAPLTLTASATSNSICAGNSVSLTAGGAATYTWQPGLQTTSIIAVSPSVTTTYTLLGASASCTANTVRQITVAPSPSINIIATQSVCNNIIGGVVTLTVNSPGNTFTWTVNNSNNPLILVTTPSVNTTYSVIATNSLGCTNTATTSVIRIDCTNLKETLSESSVAIYPNPASNFIEVVSGGTEAGRIEVVDAVGRVVLGIKHANYSTTVNIQNLNNGLYFVRLINQDNKIVKEVKLVKE